MTKKPAPEKPAVKPADVRLARIVGLALALVTLLLYLPAAGFEFNNFDDSQYITRNPWVQHGLRPETIAWAFTSGYASNWHPLTWLSHMLDWQLYGANPAGHHLTSVIFHVLNAVLLFGLLRRMTGALWRSAFVAAVFAWHPLRVESVAWVAERKDVLCAFFGLLTLWAWTSYVEKSKAQNPKSKVAYGLALLFFVLGLMSKPMLVSLPLILLLLDFWPFNRVAGFQFAEAPSSTGPAGAPWPKLLLEKLPFIALAAISCVVTFHFQKASGAMSMIREPLAVRVANALNACAAYLGKIFWPHNLSVIYPYEHHLPALQVIAAAALLVLITATVCAATRRLPFLAVGWFWFLIMLGPVIGLVQVGEQAMADRYTYLPAIGIAIMIAWGVPQLFARGASAARPLAFASGVALAACALVTLHQLQYWRNSIALFTHAIEVTSDNSVAQCNLGEALVETKPDEALRHINEALRIRPDYPQAMNNKALILSQHGQSDEALSVLQQVVKEKPDWPDARRNLGQILLDLGRLDEAAAQFHKVLEIDPADVKSLTDLGIVQARNGRFDDAIAQYRQALAIVPNAFAENALGGALDAQGHASDAAQHYQAAIELKPDFAEARNNLGALLNSTGRYGEARDQFLAALQVKPNFADAHFNLANSYLALGDLTNAAFQYAADLAIQTNDADAHLNLGRIFMRYRNWPGATNHFFAALALKPDFAEAHVGLATVYQQQGDDYGAARELREALRIGQQPPSVLRNLAWIVATSSETVLRAGAEAVRLCGLADLQSPPKTASDWDITAAAYAEANRFGEAINAARKGLEAANAGGQTNMAAQIQKRLDLYQTGTPYHQPPRN